MGGTMSLCVSLSKRGVYLFTLFAMLLTSCASHRTIVNGLDEREANEILVFLSNKGIHAEKVKSSEGGGGGGGSKTTLWDIQVSDERATEAMALLNIAGLPRRRTQSLLGIFAGGGLVPSQLEEKVRYQAGIGEQIASTIRKIDGVLDADVQLSFPEEDPLNPEKNLDKVSASVYVKHNGVLDDPNAHLVTKIRRLVASSVPGLQFDNVTVIGDKARYSDVMQPAAMGKQERQFVSIWTILVAAESVTRFRILFFTYTLIVLFAVLAIMWLIWKVYPVIKYSGGIKQLFKVKPISPGEVETPPPAPEAGDKGSATEEGPKEEPPKKEEEPKGLEEPGEVK